MKVPYEATNPLPAPANPILSKLGSPSPPFDVPFADAGGPNPGRGRGNRMKKP
jgi:hypothetical protein